jgi:hypothetical protein
MIKVESEKKAKSHAFILFKPTGLAAPASRDELGPEHRYTFTPPAVDF